MARRGRWGVQDLFSAGLQELRRVPPGRPAGLPPSRSTAGPSRRGAPTTALANGPLQSENQTCSFWQEDQGQQAASFGQMLKSKPSMILAPSYSIKSRFLILFWFHYCVFNERKHDFSESY